MQARVLLFAALREKAGAREVLVEVPAGATVAELRDAVAALHPSLAPLLRNVAAAVNEEYAAADHSLREGDTVALIPPVSGG
jgi:molybdopterin converting factor subunit 1